MEQEKVITISPSAENHFKLLLKDEEPGMNIRVFLDRPGKVDAEVGISFCSPGDQKAIDLVQQQNGFVLYIDNSSKDFLRDAVIDYKTDNMGGQLAISAPNIKGVAPTDEAPLKEKIIHFINLEINPNLAHHGGMVSLIELTRDNIVVLRFGGGCHGCSMVDVTLKDGIEKNLKQKFPQIKAVRDITDHQKGDNPYYS